MSVEFLNWAGHKAADRAADGGFFSELWDGYHAYGICPERELPYHPQYDASLQPSDSVLKRAGEAREAKLRLSWIKEWDPKTGLSGGQITAIKKTLRDGWPVCGGFRWPKEAQWDDALLRMCPPEEVFDGHSVLLVGYRDDSRVPGGGAFLIRNSGGDGREGELSYEYVRCYMNDAAWVGGDIGERPRA